MIARPINKSFAVRFKKLATRTALLGLAFSLSASFTLAAPHPVASEHALPAVTAAVEAQREELEQGKVVVGLKDVGSTKFVTGKILINESPEKVWPIMVNPFEFRGRISPRVKKVEMVTDEPNLSVMKMTMDTSPLPFLPQLSYTVESRYEKTEKGGHIEFRRVGGMIRDFRGYWDMAPADGGSKTELTYSMYIDPGFFVPQFIVREGVKGELPRTLTALRKRINGVYEGEERLERQTIVAANLGNHHTVH